ncbi:hypothetical protein HDU97_005889 [Phlyctochytrium planicorne]|nr:hypothetical protein HDU97_005889 [Phlyctochytrium planicorne]
MVDVTEAGQIPKLELGEKLSMKTILFRSFMQTIVFMSPWLIPLTIQTSWSVAGQVVMSLLICLASFLVFAMIKDHKTPLSRVLDLYSLLNGQCISKCLLFITTSPNTVEQFWALCVFQVLAERLIPRINPITAFILALMESKKKKAGSVNPLQAVPTDIENAITTTPEQEPPAKVAETTTSFQPLSALPPLSKPKTQYRSFSKTQTTPQDVFREASASPAAIIESNSTEATITDNFMPRNEYAFCSYTTTLSALGFIVVFTETYATPGQTNETMRRMMVFLILQIISESVLTIAERIWADLPVGNFLVISAYMIPFYILVVAMNGLLIFAGILGVFGIG